MWIRIEGDFFAHPKLRGLDDHVVCLHFRALCEAGQFLTDGRVTRAFVRHKRTLGYTDKLVSAGLWHTTKNLQVLCPNCWEMVGGDPGTGWVIHDFLRYNPSKVDVERKRELARLRKERWETRSERTGNAFGTLPGTYGTRDTNGTEDTGPTEARRQEIEEMMR